MILLYKLLQNTTLLFFSTFFSKATTALLFIWIARKLGPSEAGIFTLGLTYSVLLMLPWVGLDDFMLRELVRDRGKTRMYLSNFVVMRVIFTITLYLVIIVFLLFNVIYSSRIILIVGIMAITALPEGLFAVGQSVFFSHEIFKFPVFVSFFTMMIKMLGSIMALLWYGTLESLIIFYFMGSWIGALLSLSGAIKLANSINGDWYLNIKFCKNSLSIASSFILMSVLTGLGLQMDVILLSFLANETILGWFSAASTVFVMLALLSVAYRIAVFPVMIRLAIESQEKLVSFYEKSTYYILFFILPLVTLICFVTPSLLERIFMDKFEPSVMITQVLVWSVIFLFVNVPNTRLLLALDLQKWIPVFLSISLILNIIINLLLIPLLGGVGVAIARIISTSSYTIMTFVSIRRYLFRTKQNQYLKLIPRVILATIMMGITLIFLMNLSVVGAIVVGIIVYSLVVIVTQSIPAKDRQIFQKLKPQNLG